VELERDAGGKLLARFWVKTERIARLNDAETIRLQSPALPDPVALDGPWQVAFPPGLGAPASAVFEKLVSWPDRPEPGIRFFSGTAAYTKEFELPAEFFAAGREVYLDLGEVGVIARATLNGKELPTLWKPPFRVRIDRVAQPGPNRLDVRVTNLWPNRLIGDSHLEDDMEWQDAGAGVSLPAEWPAWLLQSKPRPSNRIAFCTRGGVYDKDDPLLPSGLIGPVCIRSATVSAVNLDAAKH